jgi:hypothetical protein
MFRDHAPVVFCSVTWALHASLPRYPGPYLVVLVRAVREVEASNIETSPQQLLKHLHRARLGPERADDLKTRLET